MIAVWIIATSFTFVGLLYTVPKYYKLLTCRKQTVGTIVQTASSLGSKKTSIKASYEYYVDGVRYEASTGWTTFARFSHDLSYKVNYHPHKPQLSYINRSGMYINTVIGSIFLLIGIAVFGIGIILSLAGL